MNLKQYKAEIFRRSEVKIKKRKQARRIALICIPLVLVAGLLAWPKPAAETLRQELAQDSDGMTMGSIYCSYVRAELQVDGNTISINDKLKVDKIFTIVGMEQEMADQADPESTDEISTSIPENQDFHYCSPPPKYLVILYTEDGSFQTYALTQNEYEAVLEVIK